MGKLIEISNLSKRTIKRVGWFKKASKTLLNNINLDIKEGEFVAILGKNGSGKSTLLKSIAGILYPDQGRVEIKGNSTFKHRTSLVREIGIFFGQKSLLFTDLKAIDYLNLLKKVYGLSDEEFLSMVDLLDKYMPCKNLLEKDVRGMSYGEKVKIEILSIIIHNPKLLILDEPFVALDPASQKNLLLFIMHYRKTYDATILLTTHQFLDVLEKVDRAVIIDKGEITYDGKVDRLVESYYKKKILYVIWENPSNDILVSEEKGIKILSQSFNSIELEIEVEYFTVSEVINRLLELNEIRDVEVRSLAIDKVVESLYEEHTILL